MNLKARIESPIDAGAELHSNWSMIAATGLQVRFGEAARKPSRVAAANDEGSRHRGL